MDYELAKKLKDEGFPQRHRYLMGECEKCGDIQGLQEDTPCYPTLEELIEACSMPNFALLRRDPDRGTRARWIAYAYPHDYEADTEFAEGEGKTAEEAVAKLWLALREK